MNDKTFYTSKNESSNRVVVLIPAYEPDEQLIRLIGGIKAVGLDHIVVVNDGSSPECSEYFDRAEQLGVTLCRHEKNMGKGAAVKTGIRYIAEHFENCVCIVTADADGQHSPEDIRRVAERSLQCPSSLVLGTRDFSGNNVPRNSRMGNRITSVVFRVITHVSCPDTQTGLRGISAALFPLALSSEGDRYEYEMNFLLDAAKKKVSIEMLPIETIYIDNNRASHFHVIRDSYLIYRRPVTFLLGAVSSSLVDLAAFYILSHFIFHDETAKLFSASVIARILSGTYNFIFNKKLTFRSEGGALKESLKYLCLFLAVMLISSKSVSVLGGHSAPTLLIKIVVDLILFVANYFIERKWVFKHSS